MEKQKLIKNPKPYTRPSGNIDTCGMPLYEWEFYQSGGTKIEFLKAINNTIKMIYGSKSNYCNDLLSELNATTETDQHK